MSGMRCAGMMTVVVAIVCAVGGRAGAEDAKTPRDEVLARLRAERERQIERLHAYRLARAFPTGGTRPMTAGDPHRAEGRTHQLVGRNGALCAVAHLIAATGPRERQLVLALARTENGLCVGVSPNREIAAWILHSGLTREECVRIQEPGSMVLERSEIQIAGQADVIAAHLERVEAELRENTEASLQVALDRWVEN